MSIFCHDPWANFLRSISYVMGKSRTGTHVPVSKRVYASVAHCVCNSSTVQWPKLPGYTYLRRATFVAEKEPCRDVLDVHIRIETDERFMRQSFIQD